MKTQLPFAALAAALLAGPVVAMNWPTPIQCGAKPAQDASSSSAQVEDAVSVGEMRIAASAPQLNASPRIIHVPPRGEARAIASDSMDVENTTVPDDRRDRRKPKLAPLKPDRVVTPVVPKPRRVLPPADTPKRTVLSAPPPAGELTPIYPTPHWRSNNKVQVPAQNGTAELTRGIETRAQ